MLSRIGHSFVAWAQRWVPDPFVFALGLTLLTAGLGVALTGASPAAMVGHWNKGFWSLLEFGMQMCLILVTGHALAESRPVQALLGRLAGIPRTRGAAVALVCLTAMGAALVNWGLGLIVGALLAREVGVQALRRGLRVHYPLLGAAGYTGLLIWHGGFSGSAPLKVATAGHFLEEKMGVLPVTDTLLSPMNLVVALALLVVTPLVLVALHPAREEDVQGPEHWVQEAPEDPVEAAADPGPLTPAARLERSPVLALVLALAGLGWCAWALLSPALQGAGLRGVLAVIDLNNINFFFLFLGLALHGSVRAYSEAAAEATKGVGGIILQFPFYAGIMGMVSGSGLIALLSGWMVGASEAVLGWTGLQVFPVLAFLSAGLVNLFVPSGGGQWAVQGPIVVEAALRMKLDLGHAVMAVSYGDEWTNMLQPFWALPLLGITKLEARDLIGYTLPVLLASGAVFAVLLLAF